MANIQSVNLPLWLSEDGVTYKQLVCMENYTLQITTQNTKTNTFCGIALGLGANEFSIQFAAVCESAKTASQVTNDDIVRIQLALSTIWFKIQFPSPGSSSTNIFFSGQVAVTDFSLIGAVNEVVKFSGTLTGTGTLDITP